jgi:hypothetical protein
MEREAGRFGMVFSLFMSNLINSTDGFSRYPKQIAMATQVMPARNHQKLLSYPKETQIHPGYNVIFILLLIKMNIQLINMMKMLMCLYG